MDSLQVTGLEQLQQNILNPTTKVRRLNPHQGIHVQKSSPIENQQTYLSNSVAKIQPISLIVESPIVTWRCDQIYFEGFGNRAEK